MAHPGAQTLTTSVRQLFHYVTLLRNNPHKCGKTHLMFMFYFISSLFTLMTLGTILWWFYCSCSWLWHILCLVVPPRGSLSQKGSQTLIHTLIAKRLLSHNLKSAQYLIEIFSFLSVIGYTVVLCSECLLKNKQKDKRNLPPISKTNK